VLLLAAVLVGAAAAPSAQAKRVRVFVVGPRIDLSWLDTRAHFHDKLFALFDRHLRTGSAPPVQRGAQDVASALLGPEDPGHPSGTARDLVVLPEDLGLMASFTGVLGVPARYSQAGLTGAIAGLLASYAPQAAYYEAQFPALAQRPFPPTRLLGIALTDTFASVAVETFSELADKYDVYLEAGIDMAQDWKVVCINKANFVAGAAHAPCAEENPAKVAALRAPDAPGRTYAYEATTDRMSNMALVFDPDGRLVSRQVKTYITPTELPGQLDLMPGPVSGGLTALPTPVGTLGFVTSKDAWMPDVIAKLDQAHVDVLVQPEFFVGDTVKPLGMWAPDNLKASGYSDLLRAPSFEAMALSSMTGNVFEFSADAQQGIAEKPRAIASAAAGLVGQAPAPGLSAVGRWVVQDPMAADEPIVQRRRRLAAAGEKLLPTGPACARPDEAGPCRGGQVEDVVFRDVDVGETRPYRRARMRRRGRTPFARSRALSRSRFGQRNVALAARGGSVFAAFEERRPVGGELTDQVYLVRSRDGGAHWSRRVRPTGRGPGSAAEWWPSVSVGPDGTVWVAWQDDSTKTPRVYFSRLTNGGRSFAPAVAVDATAPSRSGQLKPAIAALGPGRAAIAWIDERDRFADEVDLPQANVYFATVGPSGAARAVRLDNAAAASDLAKTLDNDWAPSIAADGDRVAVAWLDFRAYDWDVVSRASTDDGASFGPVKAVNDTPASRESLEDTPRVAIGPDGPLVAFTDYRKRADTDTDLSPHQLYDTFVAAPGGANRRVDQHGAEQVSTFAPSIALLPGGDALVAWQDAGGARGAADIYIARVPRGQGAGRAVRVDDTGSRGWNQWRPALTMARGRVLAAWEDERDGPAQIYFSRARPRRIR
jgi:hypothetical protein